MKKTYIQPSIEAVKLQTTTILAGSPKPGIDPSQTSGGNHMDGFRRGDMGFVEIDE